MTDTDEPRECQTALCLVYGIDRAICDAADFLATAELPAEMNLG